MSASESTMRASDPADCHEDTTCGIAEWSDVVDLDILKAHTCARGNPFAGPNAIVGSVAVR